MIFSGEQTYRDAKKGLSSQLCSYKSYKRTKISKTMLIVSLP